MKHEIYNREEKIQAATLSGEALLNFWKEVLTKKIRLGGERHQAHNAAQKYEEAGEPRGGSRDD